MNRPEPIELENNLGPDAVTGEINRVPWKAYDIDEVDAILAEKDKEIRRLRRALWLARAERAKEFRYKIGFAISSMNTKYDYSDADKWQKVERKCRAKAEEYK